MEETQTKQFKCVNRNIMMLHLAEGTGSEYSHLAPSISSEATSHLVVHTLHQWSLIYDIRGVLSFLFLDFSNCTFLGIEEQRSKEQTEDHHKIRTYFKTIVAPFTSKQQNQNVKEQLTEVAVMEGSDIFSVKIVEAWHCIVVIINYISSHISL